MSAPSLTPSETALDEPRARLEKIYLQAYLRAKGCTLQSLHELPDEEAKRLMTEASIYASSRLAEIETREQLLNELHGATPA